jgi:hypothetical protein
MSNARRNRLDHITALVLAAMVLGPIPSFAQFNLPETLGGLPEQLGGLPANAPQRPTGPAPKINVYEVRPTRPVKPLTPDEQKKLEAELTALRDQQKNRANPQAQPPKKAAAPAPLDIRKPAHATKPAPVAKPKPVAKRTPARPKAAPVKREAAKPEIVPDAKQPAGPMRLIN